MRSLAWALALALLAAAPAAGAGLEHVTRYPAELGATEVEVAGDLAFVVGPSGMEIVSIRDPRRPVRVSTLECEGTFDVALDPAAQIAAVAIDGRSSCMDGEGFLVVDVRDPAQPAVVASVRMPYGAHTLTMDGRTLYANQQQETLEVRQLEIFDLSVPASPRPLSVVQFPTHGPHDSFVRHRPDGRALLYTANIDAASVLDVTDPAKPRLLQTVHDPRINYAHAAEVSHDDDVIMVSDETLIGAPSGACGKAPAGPDLGALHFYGAAADGTFADGGLAKLGTWNVPLQPSGADTCTIHVFVQAPHERRVVAAWYTRGTRVADFSDPANVRELAAWDAPDDAARQSIPHNGFIYTADLDRGLDVLRYTGEGWPATAGPAEAFRFGRPPPAPPAAPAPAPAASHPAGRARLRVRVRPQPRAVRARLAVLDARGVRVAAARTRLARGRRARLAIDVVALPGRYAWTLRARGRRLARGRFAVRRTVPGLSLPAGRVARARVARR